MMYLRDMYLCVFPITEYKTLLQICCDMYLLFNLDVYLNKTSTRVIYPILINTAIQQN